MATKPITMTAEEEATDRDMAARWVSMHRGALRRAHVEIDALRRLPTMKTCGGCPHHYDTATMGPFDDEGNCPTPEPYWECLHESAPSDAQIDPASPPPTWCPLRGKP